MTWAPIAYVVAFVRGEPAVLTTLAVAGIAVGASFGVHLNASQTKELFGGAAVISGVLVRSRVTPSASVNARVAKIEATLNDLLGAKAPAVVPVAVTPSTTSATELALVAALVQAAGLTAAPAVPPAQP